MLDEWVPDFKTAIEMFETALPEMWLFRPNRTTTNKNAVTGFVTRNFDGAVRPSSQRLRATWIVTHLSKATPIVPFMRAAGVESLQALTRYVRYVPEPQPCEAVKRLRGHT